MGFKILVKARPGLPNEQLYVKVSIKYLNKLMFNTLKAMYDTHPIRVDIAGSVESIYEITILGSIYSLLHFH